MEDTNNSSGFTFDSFECTTFETRDALLAYVNNLAFDNGFACSIVRSDDKKICIACSRSGSYRKYWKVSEPRKYRSGTSKRECPFKLKATKNKCDWTLKLIDATHNHAPDFEDRSCGRSRLTTAEKEAVKLMSSFSIEPQQIYLTLRAKNDRFCGNATSIYNAKSTIKREEFNGRLSMQVMLDHFKEKAYRYSFETGSEGQLTKVSFAHPHSLKLIKMFSNVFLLDCTYKTNRYSMPLLNIVGVTSTNQTFTAFNCFMNDETAESYTWALEKFRECLEKPDENIIFVTDRELALMTAIKSIFPRRKHILCGWHIEKNILANCVGYFTNSGGFDGFFDRWSQLVNSETCEIYEKNIGELERYCHGKLKLLSYLKNTWLCYKERFIRCYVDQHMHFGHRTTSRAEGSHWSIKQVLRLSTGDLTTVTRKMDTFFTRQFDQIATEFSKDRRLQKHEYDIGIFKNLLGHISDHALINVFEAYENLDTEINLEETYCRCQLRVVYGMPCQHDISQAIKNDQSLKTDQFHDQWRIHNKNVRYIEPTARSLDEIKTKLDQFCQLYASGNEELQKRMSKGLEELLGYPTIIPKQPNIVSSRGRNSKIARTSTKREPSTHELIFKSEKKPRCSFCRGTGHNVKTCPKRQQTESRKLIDPTDEVIIRFGPSILLLMSHFIIWQSC